MAKAAGRSARHSVWLADRARRGGRGGQPSGLDRERITEASVRLLDAEGLAGFSMRRLAAELNVTAMSLYWYVDTKDDLLELALDATYAELRLPESEKPENTENPENPAEDWREQLRELATAYRTLLVRHPWVSPLAGRFLDIGPHSVAFSRAIQRVVRGTGLPDHGVTGAISAVFRFVYGFGTVEGHFLARSADTGLTPDEYVEQAMTVVAEAPGTAEVVRESRALMAARGGDTVGEMMERDFAFALDLLVAGIEAMVARG
ncbi:TetR/AcrR family transcriptional regulator [Streptomyces sp. NPDC100445]|uniref:TetR/AcrR family transcriptional regulator n=1 Tax=Streptomyces sp. NPDC100445 TaxID=3366102 RepID=UPI0038303943